MKEKKIYLYKYGSIVLIIIDLLMIYKCMFFEISEKLVSYLQIGDSFLGILSSLTSETFQSALNSISKGKISLWEFQKIYAILADYLYTEESGKNLYTLTQIFYWIMVAFVVIGIIEAVMHVLDSKFNGLFCLMDILLGVGVFYFWWITINGFEDEFGSSVIRFTPWAIAVLVMPFIATILWEKYRSILDKVKEDALSNQQHSVQAQLEFNTAELGIFLTKYKHVIIVLCIYFFLHLLPVILGVSIYEIQSYIELIDAVLVGMMIIYAVHQEWKILIIYVASELLGNLIFYHEYIQYYNFYYLVKILGSGLILTLCIYFLMKLKPSKYKFTIICGVAILLKVFLIPLYGAGYFTPNHYYTTVMDIIGNRYTVFKIVGILCPIIIYIVKPNYLYKFMDLNPETGVSIENESAHVSEEKIDDRKPDSYAEIKKLDSKLKETREKIDSACVSIGVKLCEFDYGSDDTYRELRNRIVDLKTQNEQIKERINYINGIHVCPVCSSKNKVDSIFCMQCGRKLIEEDKEDN